MGSEERFVFGGEIWVQRRYLWSEERFVFRGEIWVQRRVATRDESDSQIKHMIAA